MRVISFMVLIAAATSANAQTDLVTADCDQSSAEEKLLKASDAGIIKGVGIVNEIPSIAVTGDLWDGMTLDTRLGMIETLECFVAGPGNILKSVQVMSPGGKVFAVFDGVSRKLDVKR